jgi:hypothetical protein
MGSSSSGVSRHKWCVCAPHQLAECSGQAKICPRSECGVGTFISDVAALLDQSGKTHLAPPLPTVTSNPTGSRHVACSGSRISLSKATRVLVVIYSIFGAAADHF